MVLKYIVYFHIIFNRNSLLNCYIEISLCYTSFWRTPILVRVHSRVGGGRNFKILEMEDFWTFLVMHPLPPSLLSLKHTTHTHTQTHACARTHTHTTQLRNFVKGRIKNIVQMPFSVCAHF